MPPYCEEHKTYHNGSPFECAAMRARVRKEAKAQALRAKAERIATEVLKAHGTDYRVDGWWCDCGHRYGVAPSALADKVQMHRMESAALAALTGKDDAS